MAKKKISPEAQAILSASDAGLLATTVMLVKEFLQDNPASQRAWMDLGRSLGELARYEEAESAYQQAIELAGDAPCDVIFGEIGNLYRSQGKFETAITWYQKQIDANPQDSTGYLYLGNLYLRQGKLVESESLFQQALGCQLVCGEETHFALGLVNRSMGLLRESKAHFEAALNCYPNFAEAKLALKDVKNVLANDATQA